MRIYIHIPFCEQKCHYCAFNSFVSPSSTYQPYMQALLAQIKLLLEHYNVTQIESVFIGGGTPSVILPSLYKPIFETLSQLLSKECEISIEANPTTATLDWLEEMYNLGVNRLSLGVQSFNDEKLKFLGRNHKSIDAHRALESALKAGFENISIDLIYGTAFDTKSILKKDLQSALSFPLTHLSAYTLSIEEGTPFFKQKGVANDIEKHAYMVKDLLLKYNMPQYEVSNFGTKPCRHNQAYWRYEPYLGAGCGAVGFDGKKRYSANKNIALYLENPNSLDFEKITSDEHFFEQLFLGLRSNIGISEDIMSPLVKKRAQTLVNENLLKFKNGNYYSKDYFLADSLVLFIVQ